MRDIIETIKYKNYDINIHIDEYPESPRQWDNLGTIYYCSSRYILGDKQVDRKVIQDIMNDPNYFYLPVYAYIHSGVSLWTNYNTMRDHVPPSHLGWDTGMSGIIAVSKKKIRKEYTVKRVTNKLKDKIGVYLNNEIEIFNQYLNGDIYGYSVMLNGKQIDSCYGYYGTNWKENGLLDSAESEADYDNEKIKEYEGML